MKLLRDISIDIVYVSNSRQLNMLSLFLISENHNRLLLSEYEIIYDNVEKYADHYRATHNY